MPDTAAKPEEPSAASLGAPLNGDPPGAPASGCAAQTTGTPAPTGEGPPEGGSLRGAPAGTSSPPTGKSEEAAVAAFHKAIRGGDFVTVEKVLEDPQNAWLVNALDGHRR